MKCKKINTLCHPNYNNTLASIATLINVKTLLIVGIMKLNVANYNTDHIITYISPYITMIFGKKSKTLSHAPSQHRKEREYDYSNITYKYSFSY